MRRSRARFAIAALATVAAACSPPPHATAPNGPVLGVGPYHFVSVSAVAVEGKTIHLRLSNDGQFAACVLAASLPDASSRAVQLLAANGAERRLGSAPHYATEL